MEEFSVGELNEIRKIRTQFAHQALYGFMFLGIPVLIASLLRIASIGWNNSFLVFIVASFIPYALYFFRHRISYHVIVYVILGLLVATGVTGFIFYSFFSLALFYFFVAIIFSIIFFGIRFSMIISGGLIAFLCGVGVLFFGGWLRFDVDFNLYNSLKAVWLTQLLTFMLFSLVGIVIFNKYLHTLYETIRRISQQKGELKVSISKAEESDRLKTTFLQNMSHEVRTPMNAIIGFSSLLLENDVDAEKQKEYLKIITQRSADLLAIMNDILDISRLESGNTELKAVSTDVSMLLYDMYSAYEVKNQAFYKKPIQIHLSISIDKYQSRTSIDAERLRQVITYLMDNAFKFTDRGEVRLNCSWREPGTLLFSVADTGIGIDPGKIDVIFEHFRQADDAVMSRKYGGTGLGLSIAKKLVALMGGELWVESEPGKGSTFYFTIPFVAWDTACRGNDQCKKHGRTVLVAPGSHENQEQPREVLNDRVL